MDGKQLVCAWPFKSMVFFTKINGLISYKIIKFVAHNWIFGVSGMSNITSDTCTSCVFFSQIVYTYLKCSWQYSRAGLFLSVTVVVDTAVTCCLRGARVVWWRRCVRTPATASGDLFTDDGKGGNWRKSCENSSIWCVSLREGTIVRKKTSLFNRGGLKGIGIESLLSI